MEINIDYPSEDLVDKIPFIDILLRYTEEFIDKLSETHISQQLLKKLHRALLVELGNLSESVLHHELEKFTNVEKGDYRDFLIYIQLELSSKYPVLDNILKNTSKKFLIYIQTITTNYNKDVGNIAAVFGISIDKEDRIEDIDASIGDGHNGESTALIKLSNDIKLIYKPRNIKVTQSYNTFIEWVAEKLKVHLKTFKLLDYESYGWLEYVEHEEVSSKEELAEYYYRAGVLLAVTLVLGSRDCHYENVIASGNHPVLIDHETIIQPILYNQLIDSWERKNNLPAYSVLESILIVNKTTGIQLDYAGFGVKGEAAMLSMENKFSGLNTIYSKKTNHLVIKNRFKNNIPLCNKVYAFANDYEKRFIDGFSEAYDLFTSSIDELIHSPESPINKFKNLETRYVWRPTIVYCKIHNYMNNYLYMSNYTLYKNKLRDLLSVAYKKEHLGRYLFVLDSEVEQMMNGEIPYFSLNSLNYCFNKIDFHKIFQFNCVENIIYRLENLSLVHRRQQIGYILEWIKMVRLS